MFPYLLDFGTHDLPLFGETHLFLPTYGLLFALGTLLAWWWFMRRGRSLGVAEEPLFNLTFYTLLGGIVGAKVTLVLLDLRSYLEHPSDLLGTLRSAGVLIGGVVAGSLVFALYARSHRLPLFRLGDAIAAPLALAQGIGRLGCYAAGCCWGVQCPREHPLSVVFTNPAASSQTGVPLHVPLVATQLIQMTGDLALAGLLTWLWRRRLQPAGTVFWIYVLIYGVLRGIVEFWRGDEHRGLFLGETVSTSQLLSAAAILFAVTMLIRRRGAAPEESSRDAQAASPRRA